LVFKLSRCIFYLLNNIKYLKSASTRITAFCFAYATQKPYAWRKHKSKTPFWVFLICAHQRDKDRTFMTEDDTLTGPLLNLLAFKKKDLREDAA